MIFSRVRLLASAGILGGAITAATVGGAFASPVASPTTFNAAAAAAVAPATPSAQTTPTARPAQAKSDHHLSPREVFGHVAKLLGVTPTELKTDLSQGQTLAQVAAAHGTSADQVQTSVLAELKV